MSEFVSMPSTGFYPFLLSSGSAIAAPSKECQCPQRASIHFYIQYTRKIILWRDVSMPSTGFYPFLQIKSEIDSKKESNCVNALNGLLSISTILTKTIIAAIIIVSMPSTGFYPFLPSLRFSFDVTGRVSMPSTGFYPFLR